MVIAFRSARIRYGLKRLWAGLASDYAPWRLRKLETMSCAMASNMVKTFSSLILLPLLLFLEVGVGPLHNFLPGEEPSANPAVMIWSTPVDSTPPLTCPVCRFLQVSFLLSMILFSSSFRRRSQRVSVREIAFPAQPRKILPSRGPPAY